MGRSAAQDIRRRLDRLKGQPQERQHSAAVRRDAGPIAPGEAFRISCARDESSKGRDPTFADAILDRLVHNAHRLALDGPSMRDPKTAKLDTTAPGPSAADTTVTKPATGAKK
jgi:hypothetical protein